MALIQIAEGYVERAKLESAAAGRGAMVAAHWLAQAVETYRNLPQQRGRYISTVLLSPSNSTTSSVGIQEG